MRPSPVTDVIVEVPVAIAPYALHPEVSVPDDGHTVRFWLGKLKLGWLKAFAESARTCTLIPSVREKDLPSDRFTVLKAGPVN